MTSHSSLLWSAFWIVIIAGASHSTSEIVLDRFSLINVKQIPSKRDEASKHIAPMSQVYNLEFEELAIYDLDDLFGLMSSYIHELSFDDVGFDLQAEEIAKLLDKFEILVANNTVTSIEGVKRFWFAKSMFQVMNEASAYLKYYQIRGTDQFLVRRVIQFNVGLLAFFDPTGNPDVMMPDYQISLQTFARILETWEKMFVNLDKIPLGAGKIFTTETTKATNTLEFLISRSSKDWAYIGNNFVKNLLESLGH